MKTLGSLTRVLAFHVANKNYAFTDILANALNAEAIQMALYDAIRDYQSLCLSERKESEKRDMCCPQVEDIEYIYADVHSVFEEKPLLELLKMSREIAVRAQALSIIMCKERDASGKQQEQQGAKR